MDPRFLHTARPSTGDRTPPARPRRRMPVGPVPASGAWRQGDPVGRRHFAELGPLHLEAGGRLPEVRLAYERSGEGRGGGGGGGGWTVGGWTEEDACDGSKITSESVDDVSVGGVDVE